MRGKARAVYIGKVTCPKCGKEGILELALTQAKNRTFQAKFRVKHVSTKTQKFPECCLKSVCQTLS